jgi:hypothetical protein
MSVRKKLKSVGNSTRKLGEKGLNVVGKSATKFSRSASKLGKSVGKGASRLGKKGWKAARNKIKAARIARLKAREATNDKKIDKIDDKHQKGYTALEKIINISDNKEVEKLTPTELEKIKQSLKVICRKNFKKAVKDYIKFKKNEQTIDTDLAKIKNNQLKF